MRKSWDEWIRWVTITWNKTFRNFSRKLGFTAKVYCVWQEWNARIFVGMSRNLNLVFDQIEGIITSSIL
jgi:hypothetical protein